MITTTEIICDVFSFLDKDQIERTQLINKFWNNVIIRHKNILPLRLSGDLVFSSDGFYLKERDKEGHCFFNYNFDGTNLSKGQMSLRYWQLTIDELLKNLNDVVFHIIIVHNYPELHIHLLNLMKLVTTKIGGRFRGRFGCYNDGRFGSKLNEIFDNYIIVDELALRDSSRSDSYIREVCANPEIVQLPSTPKEIRLARLEFKENEEVLHFTCNGKLNGANRVTIAFNTDTNYGNFIRQWFEFELSSYFVNFDIVLDAVKTFLSNTQLRVKYSLETKDFFHSVCYGVIDQYVKRSCVLHETDSYALVIEMAYGEVIDISSINASDLDQPPCDKIKIISFCVKSL